MSFSLKRLVKENLVIYNLYYLLASSVVRLAGLFIKTDDKMILITSFAGKRYDDSPRAIYEYMSGQDDLKDYKFVWAFENPALYSKLNLQSVRIDTLQYFKAALKAKYWITNSSIERGLRFKKKSTVYLNTWHGTPIKRMGSDTSAPNNFIIHKNPHSPYDYFLAQSKYEIDVFSKAFSLPLSVFRLTGLPRNDALVGVTSSEINEIKHELNIPRNKKVLLYAPTYRDKAVAGHKLTGNPIDIDRWSKQLSKTHVLLVRSHTEQNAFRNIDNSNFVRDVSAYPELSKLLKITDILISDYSSIVIDFSILQRPIYCYIYDIDEYRKGRGLYLDIEQALPGMCFKKDADLLFAISHNNQAHAISVARSFRDTYVQEYGTACSSVARILRERL